MALSESTAAAVLVADARKLATGERRHALRCEFAFPGRRYSCQSRPLWLAKALSPAVQLYTACTLNCWRCVRVAAQSRVVV